MAVKDNTITTADTCEALDDEFVENFKKDYDKLAETLDLFGVETLKAGAALYQYKVTGALSTTTPAEGDETPLSKYSVSKEIIGEISLKRYAKLTTAEAILKGGIENAILKTDRHMSQHLRAVALSDFYGYLAKGTGKVSGTVDTLQKALAKADAAIGDAMEKNGDQGGTLVHFVNRQDAADYLGEHEVTMQTAFGLTYLESFLGAENVVLTSSVKAGTVTVTPIENIHPYAVDFASLADAGLDYESDDYGIVGIHHVPDYDRGSVDTYAALGLTIVPEVKDYIVNATFKAGA